MFKQTDELWWLVSTGEKQTAQAEGARPSAPTAAPGVPLATAGFAQGLRSPGPVGTGSCARPPAPLCCKGAKLKPLHRTVLKLF